MSVPSREVQASEVQAHYAEWELRKSEYIGSDFPVDLKALSNVQLASLVQTLSQLRNNDMYRMTVIVPWR